MHSPEAELAQIRSRTVADLFPLAVDAYASRTALTTKRDGQWVEVSYAEVGAIVSEIALGLLSLGLARGDRVAILAGTRPQWTYVDFALSTAGATIVPIYPTNSGDECRWVLADSESRMIVCDDAAQLAKIAAIRDELPALEHVIVMDPDASGLDVISIDQLREAGKHVDAAELRNRTASVEPSDPYTIIYTSGTTGRPKGCVLSHRNFRATLDSLSAIQLIRPDDLTYLFLPLAHVFSLVLQLMSFDRGAALAYFGGDPTKVISELREVKPTYFPSVPRIFEKIYAQVAPSLTAELGEGRLRELVTLGVQVRDLEYAGREVPAHLHREWYPAAEQIFEQVRAVFGGRIRGAGTGAAPIEAEVIEFFYAAGIPVLEGYGMTETATAITASTPERHKFGTVGCPVPGVQITIADDGEIFVKGGNVFEGYFRNAEATAEALVDGWLRTGDLGSIDEDGYLSITGRKKDIIITAGGKNLTPSNLENDMKLLRYISQAVMHGDRRPYPVMLFTLDPEEMTSWARERGKPEDVATLSKDPEVLALIQNTLDRVNARYAQVEQVKKFVVLGHDLTHQSGELTPTMKVKRNVVNERYATLFDSLYSA